MTEQTLDAQIAKDREVVAALDKKLKDLYVQELRAVVDRSKVSQVAPQTRVVLSY
jgi:hypothetical protein